MKNKHSFCNKYQKDLELLGSMIVEVASESQAYLRANKTERKAIADEVDAYRREIKVLIRRMKELTPETFPFFELREKVRDMFDSDPTFDPNEPCVEKDGLLYGTVTILGRRLPVVGSDVIQSFNGEQINDCVSVQPNKELTAVLTLESGPTKLIIDGVRHKPVKDAYTYERVSGNSGHYVISGKMYNPGSGNVHFIYDSISEQVFHDRELGKNLSLTLLPVPNDPLKSHYVAESLMADTQPPAEAMTVETYGAGQEILKPIVPRSTHYVDGQLNAIGIVMNKGWMITFNGTPCINIDNMRIHRVHTFINKDNTINGAFDFENMRANRLVLNGVIQSAIDGKQYQSVECFTQTQSGWGYFVTFNSGEQVLYWNGKKIKTFRDGNRERPITGVWKLFSVADMPCGEFLTPHERDGNNMARRVMLGEAVKEY